MFLKCSKNNGARGGSSDGCSSSLAGDDESAEPPNLGAGSTNGRLAPAPSPSCPQAPLATLAGFTAAPHGDLLRTGCDVVEEQQKLGVVHVENFTILTTEIGTKEKENDNVLILSPSTTKFVDENSDASSDTSFDFDHYLTTTVGDFGRYQQFVVWLLCVPACFLSAYSTLDMVFIAFTPEHTCDVQQSLRRHLDQSPWPENDNRTLMMIPVGRAIEGEKCEFELVHANTSSRLPCTSWVYDKTYFEQTLITRWDLVCSQALTARSLMSLLNISVLFAAVYTYLGDRWGRKVAFLINLTVYLAGTLSSLLAPNPIVFGLFKFVGSITCMWEICYVWALEFVGPAQRTAMTTMLSVVFCFATISLALFGWLCNSWTEFGLCTTAPFILLFVYSFFVPESPRWLITQGRFDDAVKIFERMARWQNVKIDLVALRRAMAAGTSRNQNQDDNNNQSIIGDGGGVESAIVANISDKGSASSTAALLPMAEPAPEVVAVGGKKTVTPGVDEIRSNISEESAGSKSLGLMGFVTNTNLFRKSLFLTIIEVMSNQLYFAIPYSLESLSANFYLAYVLQAAVEAPATLLNLLLLNRFGRVVPLCCSLMLSGTCCLLTIAAGNGQSDGLGWLLVSLVVLSRFFICTSVAITEQLGGELFPTVARGTGQGISYLVSAVTSMAMQYVLYSAHLWRHLPMLIFGTTVLLASLMSLFLPETMGQSMPDTVRQAERQGSVGLDALKRNIPRLLKLLGKGPLLKKRRPVPGLAQAFYDPMMLGTNGKV